MLLELHVKNLALIEKADVEFGEGLNILTGETGAGKSIIIGSVTMALGGKASKDVIRRGADHAYIELIFFVDGKENIWYLSSDVHRWMIRSLQCMLLSMSQTLKIRKLVVTL